MPTKLALLPLLALGLVACGATRARPTTLAHASPAASKTRLVGTHGIELAVPAEWPDNKGLCGTPKANTVMWNEDGVAACATGQPPGLSVVEFGGLAPGPHARRTTIGALTVRESAAHRVAGSREVRIAVLRHGITVVVLSPDRALLRRIIGSLHAVRVDANGCPTRTPSGGYRHGSRPARGAALVPAGAVRVVACSYQTTWIDRSNRLGHGGASRLTRALNAAPFGFSRPPRGTYLPSICGSSWRGSRIVAHFEYKHRPPVVVTAHLDGCSRLGASNGRWAVRMKQRWVFALVDASRYGGSFPDLSGVR